MSCQALKSTGKGGDDRTVLAHYLAGTGKGSVYVDWVLLELGVFHGPPAEFFAVCVPVPVGRPLPDFAVAGPEAGPIVFPVAWNDSKEGGICPALWDLTHLAVRSAGESAFQDVARDGSLFDAPLKARVCPTGDYRVANRRDVPHGGRASWKFDRKGEFNGAQTKTLVKESLRAFWPFDKVLEVSDDSGEPVGNRWVILCGFRALTVNADPHAEASVLGSLNHLKLTAHIRHH
jgi:hypothetical protein